MDGPKFGISDREIAVRPTAFFENLHMARATHRFETVRVVVTFERKHVSPEFLPVTALFPKIARDDLRSPHFNKAGLTHPDPDIFLDDPIKDHAARMPEDGARTFILLMKQIEFVAEHSMIEIVHHVLR
ncbi:ABC1 domain-containing protein [Burkholderia ambifaria]